MKVKDGKIVEATEEELFNVYCRSEWFDAMAFPDFVKACKKAGTKIVKEIDHEVS